MSDASSGSPRQTVPIIVTSLMPPRLIRNVPLMVDQDSVAVISADKNFDIEDDDSPAAVTVRVVEGTVRCSLHLVPCCRGEVGHLSHRCTATAVTFFHHYVLLAFPPPLFFFLQ